MKVLYVSCSPNATGVSCENYEIRKIVVCISCCGNINSSPPVIVKHFGLFEKILRKLRILEKQYVRQLSNRSLFHAGRYEA